MTCAWCGHPLADTGPSADFCGEACAAHWRRHQCEHPNPQRERAAS